MGRSSMLFKSNTTNFAPPLAASAFYSVLLPGYQIGCVSWVKDPSVWLESQRIHNTMRHLSSDLSSLLLRVHIIQVLVGNLISDVHCREVKYNSNLNSIFISQPIFSETELTLQSSVHTSTAEWNTLFFEAGRIFNKLKQNCDTLTPKNCLPISAMAEIYTHFTSSRR